MPVELPKGILCPVDLSELSGSALRYAAELSKSAGAQLTVLFANSFSPPPYFTESRLDEFRRQYEASFEEASAALRGFAQKHGAQGAVLKVLEALPADAIHLVSTELNSDLVVMGTHGRTGMNRFMLGSVAERVLRQSRIPVVTVRDAGRLPVRTILCPVNNTEAARRSLAYAAALAQGMQAEVTALHVSGGEAGSETSIADLCAWVGSEKRLCSVRELVTTGEPAEQIVSLSSSYDLLVIGSRHRTFFDSTVIGSTTARVVRHAACPVLTYIEKG